MRGSEDVLGDILQRQYRHRTRCCFRRPAPARFVQRHFQEITAGHDQHHRNLSKHPSLCAGPRATHIQIIDAAPRAHPRSLSVHARATRGERRLRVSGPKYRPVNFGLRGAPVTVAQPVKEGCDDRRGVVIRARSTVHRAGNIRPHSEGHGAGQKRPITQKECPA